MNFTPTLHVNEWIRTDKSGSVWSQKPKDNNIWDHI
jgi:hypothetical protein